MDTTYYCKYNKYKLKYIDFNKQTGGSKKTFYIQQAYTINNEFIEYLKLLLIKKKWIESSKLPINFIYVNNLKLRQNYIDNINNNTKHSDLINVITGNTYNNLIDNNLFIKKYKNNYFIHPFYEININNITNIYKQYILEPILDTLIATSYNAYIDYPLTIVSSKNEIKKIIETNTQYKSWIIKDLLSEPILKNGYRFALNVLFIIKLDGNKCKIYLHKKKLYTLAKKMYNKDTFYTDPYVRETVPYHLYDKDLSIKDNTYQSDILFFPDVLPDNWTKKDALEMDSMINNIIPILFQSKIDLQPGANSKNGYFIFNGIVELYEGLPPMLFGIYQDFYPFLYKNLAPALISILIDNKDHPDFERVNLKKIKKFVKKDNYKFDRQFSYARTTEYKPIKNTFYVNVTYDSDFENDMSTQLIKKGFKKSTDYPVEFIFLSGDCVRWKNRFDASGSKWISLLYGNSKSEICNKILLNKKFENSDFTIRGEYINSYEILHNNQIINIDKIKILKPLKGAAGDGITIVKTNDDIIKWIKQYEQFKEWLLQDYLMDPDLIDGYKFHFRVIVLVKIMKNTQPEIFMSNSQFYYTANEKYKKEDWFNKNIHDSHWKAGQIKMFPDYLPDNWNTQDANNAVKDMHRIIKEVFQNQTEFYPEWNATNGFELFGSDFIFENKHPYLLEINLRTGLKETNSIIPGVLKTILDNQENEYFTKLL